MLTKEERNEFLARLKEEGLWIIKDAEEKYRDDKIIMLGLVKLNGAILHFASERLKKEDVELVTTALDNPNDFLGTFNGKKHTFTIEAVDKDFLMKNPKYVIDFLSRNMANYRVLSDEVLNMPEIRKYMLDNIDKNPYMWLDLPNEERFNKDVVMKVINSMPNMVGELPLEMQLDPDIIAEASRDHHPDFHAVEALYDHLDPSAKTDSRVCEILVKADPRVFPYVRVKTDSAIRVALAYDGDYLDCVEEEAKDNDEYVKIAVAQNGISLQYASSRLQEDIDIVKTAVSVNGWSINNASKKVIDENPELVDKAISTSPELTNYGWKKSNRKQ